MTDFLQHLGEIQEQYKGKLRAVHVEIVDTAVKWLREDISDPRLTSPVVLPDTFMLRANQIGLALLQSGFFAAAERLYQRLAEEATEYRQASGNWRHTGALHANTAGACAAQGNLDCAVVELLKAAEDDKLTYKVPKGDSFAITGLLQEYFGKPARDSALNFAQEVNHDLTLADVEHLCGYLGSREYAFLAYVYNAALHERLNRTFQNEFSQMQLFSALRNLSCLLEVELKALTGNPSITFFPTLKALYRTKPWWNDFESARTRIGATERSKKAIDDQLRDAVALAPTDRVSRFWKSLLIAYVVRNYTTHQMDIQCALTQTYYKDALGHILHVMICAAQWA